MQCIVPSMYIPYTPMQGKPQEKWQLVIHSICIHEQLTLPHTQYVDTVQKGLVHSCETQFKNG